MQCQQQVIQGSEMFLYYSACLRLHYLFACFEITSINPIKKSATQTQWLLWSRQKRWNCQASASKHNPMKNKWQQWRQGSVLSSRLFRTRKALFEKRLPCYVFPILFPFRAQKQWLTVNQSTVYSMFRSTLLLSHPTILVLWCKIDCKDKLMTNVQEPKKIMKLCAYYNILYVSENSSTSKASASIKN